MRSALDFFVDLGAWALPTVWLPVLAWTVLALVVEAALRLRPHPVVALGVRRALVWALPVGVGAALVLPGLLPTGAVEQVLALRPSGLSGAVLPTIEIGVAGAPGAEAAEPLPLLPLVAGLALALVAAVAALRLGRVALGLARLRRLSAGAAPESVQRETAEAARAAGVARPVRAVASSTPTVPFTFGWRRPVVVVPEGLGAEALRLVLAHEVAHVARGDFAAGVAERVITALFGWHPLVGALARRVDLDRERATDAAVLAGHPTRRRDYASLLLSFSRLPSPALALGAAPGSHSLTTRITDMDRSPLPLSHLRRLARASRLLGAALFLLAVSAAALVAVGPSQTRVLAATLSADGLELDHPVVTIDGVEVLRGEGTLSARPFGHINVAVGSWGQFILSDRPFEGAEPAGQIGRDGIAATVGGHTVTIAIASQPFAESATRRAYARFEAYPGAAPLVPGDPRLDEVWFSVSSSLDVTMPLRATYRDRQMMDDASYSTVLEEAGEALASEMDDMMEAVRGDEILEPMDDAEVLEPTQAADEMTLRARPAARDTVFEVVQEMPAPVGGMAALMRNVTYPAEAKAEGVEGLAVIRFVVGADGAVRDGECVRNPDARLCSAALMAAAKTAFTPGRQNDEAVPVRVVLPVRFALDTDE